MTAPQRLIVLVVGALALAGCSLLAGKREELTIYAPTLTRLASAAESQQSARHWQLAIAQPLVISPLDGDRIVVMPRAGEIQFYKGARWRDNSPAMIQDLLVRAFRDSTNVTAFAAPTGGVHADFTLRSDLQDFQAEYRAARVPTVAVRINVQFVDNSNGHALASRSFTTQHTSVGTDLPHVFAAFEQALNELLPQIVSWTVEVGDASWHASQSQSVRQPPPPSR